VSKGCGAAPGLRGGWLTCFDAQLATQLAKIQAACTANCSSVAQAGLAASLRHILDKPEVLTEVYAYYSQRTEFCVRRLNEIGARLLPAHPEVARVSAGTFYVLADFSGWSSLADDRDIQRFLRDQYRLNTTRKTGLACVPGAAFQLDPKAKLIRFSCAVDMQTLEEAMLVVEEAIEASMSSIAVAASASAVAADKH
jgi:aspartate/methionine/tyrosine aminotransferase